LFQYPQQVFKLRFDEMNSVFNFRITNDIAQLQLRKLLTKTDCILTVIIYDDHSLKNTIAKEK